VRDHPGRRSSHVVVPSTRWSSHEREDMTPESFLVRARKCCTFDPYADPRAAFLDDEGSPKKPLPRRLDNANAATGWATLEDTRAAAPPVPR
jgi:hypothetical protein